MEQQRELGYSEVNRARQPFRASYPLQYFQWRCDRAPRSGCAGGIVQARWPKDERYTA
jgi:hypothetical protein